MEKVIVIKLDLNTIANEFIILFENPSYELFIITV